MSYLHVSGGGGRGPLLPYQGLTRLKTNGQIKFRTRTSLCWIQFILPAATGQQTYIVNLTNDRTPGYCSANEWLNAIRQTPLRPTVGKRQLCALGKVSPRQHSTVPPWRHFQQTKKGQLIYPPYMELRRYYTKTNVRLAVSDVMDMATV